MCTAQAQEFYVSINGAKQGIFHGESQAQGHENQIQGLKYDFQVAVPRDVSTGQATGRRQYQPIMFQKRWGAATVQIYSALATNETLKNVTFFFYSSNSDGQPVLQFKVTLTNAHVVTIHQHIGDPMPDGTLNTDRLEDISVSFQTITIEDRSNSGGDSLQANSAPANPAPGKTAPAKAAKTAQVRPAPKSAMSLALLVAPHKP